jgi:hypothetical protein
MLAGSTRDACASGRVLHGLPSERRIAPAGVSGAAGTHSTKSANIAERLSRMVAGGSPVRVIHPATNSASGMRSRAPNSGVMQPAGSRAKLSMVAETAAMPSGFMRPFPRVKEILSGAQHENARRGHHKCGHP